MTEQPVTLPRLKALERAAEETMDSDEPVGKKRKVVDQIANGENSMDQNEDDDNNLSFLRTELDDVSF